MRLIEQSALAEAAEELIHELQPLVDRCASRGLHMTVFVTERNEDGVISYAIGSTIDDHEDLMETIIDVIDELTEPYKQEGDEEDEPAEPTRTLQ